MNLEDAITKIKQIIEQHYKDTGQEITNITPNIIGRNFNTISVQLEITIKK